MGKEGDKVTSRNQICFLIKNAREKEASATFISSAGVLCLADRDTGLPSGNRAAYGWVMLTKVQESGKELPSSCTPTGNSSLPQREP